MDECQGGGVKAASDDGENKKAKLTSNDDPKDRRSTNKQNTAYKSNTRRSNNNSRSRKNDAPDVQLSKSLSWLLRHTAPSLGLHPTSDGYIPVNEILALNHPRFQQGNATAKYTVQDVLRVVENSDKQRFRLECKDLSHGAADNTNICQSNNDFATTSNDTSSTSNNITKNDELTLCIRANQGHSYKNVIDNDKLLAPLTTEELSDPNLSIIHGTTRKAWEDHIRIEGLSRMKRNHIHFATGLPQSHDTNSNDGTQTNNVAPISGMRSTSQIYIYINGERCAQDGIQFFRSDNGVILTAGERHEGMLYVKYFKKVVLASSGKILLDED